MELLASEKVHMSPDFRVHSGANFRASVLTEEDGIYQYDAIGNLVADLDEGLKIKWTPYGKVREVQRGDSTTIRFRYDASGNRIEKSVSNGIDTVITRYVRDAGGNVMAVYNGTAVAEQPIYGSGRLGLYRGGDSTGARTLGHRNYELTNHLGNVLAVVTDNIHMAGDSTWASTVSTADYYPFGLPMAGRSWNDSTYRYGFNGKERDDEIKGAGNHLDFEARMYNPAIGRNLSIDPLGFAAYPQVSHYTGFNNNPIANVDKEGKLILFFNGFWPGNKTTPAIQYWDSELISRVAWNFMDYEAMYFNGHNEAFRQVGSVLLPTFAYERKVKGLIEGVLQANNIYNALTKQRETNPNAKINFVAHSMGAAYSEGFLKALRLATDKDGNQLFSNKDFGDGIYLAPYQPNDINAPEYVNTTQYSHYNDAIAGFSKINQIGNYSVRFKTYRGDPFGHINGSFIDLFRPSGWGSDSQPKDKTHYDLSNNKNEIEQCNCPNSRDPNP